MNKDKLRHEVNYCRIAKAWDKRFIKLQVNCVPQTASWKLWQRIKEKIVLVPDKYVELPGIAPEGDMEKKLQEFLKQSTEH